MIDGEAARDGRDIRGSGDAILMAMTDHNDV